MTPNQVNGPPRKKYKNICVLLAQGKIPEMAPKMAKRIFPLRIKNLQACWAGWIVKLRISFWGFLQDVPSLKIP